MTERRRPVERLEPIKDKAKDSKIVENFEVQNRKRKEMIEKER